MALVINRVSGTLPHGATCNDLGLGIVARRMSLTTFVVELAFALNLSTCPWGKDDFAGLVMVLGCRFVGYALYASILEACDRRTAHDTTSTS